MSNISHISYFVKCEAYPVSREFLTTDFADLFRILRSVSRWRNLRIRASD